MARAAVEQHERAQVDSCEAGAVLARVLVAAGKAPRRKRSPPPRWLAPLTSWRGRSPPLTWSSGRSTRGWQSHAWARRSPRVCQRYHSGSRPSCCWPRLSRPTARRCGGGPACAPSPTKERRRVSSWSRRRRRTAALATADTLRLCLRLQPRLLGRPRHEHRDLAAVRLVPVSVSLHEVTLFELDGDEDVSHRRHGEDQVRDGHRRRRPEGDDETEIDGMADVPIEGGSPEPKRPVRLALQIHEHLPQAEEIEMVDEEGADQHDAKAHQGESLQRDADLRRLDVPHDSTDGLPVPEEQDQRQAGEEHVRAALDGWRNDLRPHLLEALPRHHAVLDGEHREQDGIDDERLAQRSGGRRIDGPWHEQVIDESDRVEERAEENQVAH